MTMVLQMCRYTNILILIIHTADTSEPGSTLLNNQPHFTFCLVIGNEMAIQSKYQARQPKSERKPFFFFF